MIFSSLIFLSIFLPIFLSIYYAAPSKYRNLVALSGSLFFYSWGAPKFIFVLIGSSMCDYLISKRIHTNTIGSLSRRYWLICALVINLSVFLYCKYINFFVDQVNIILDALNMQCIAWSRVVLPIGISFFTFQKMSYLVDVYRGVQPAGSLGTYILYVSLFPQLIAGPIVRYHDIAKQLVKRNHNSNRMFAGIWRFSIGLGKKVLIANSLGELADAAFNAPACSLTTAGAWIGIFCYTFQIYFDFSGYSDMAIGLGKMMGFEFLENFNAPYISRNFTEFWRRWHISLSNWMKEYLYIPLGGNHKGPVRSIANLWIVFILSGFWHGAAWTFIIWGCYHGLFLTLDKFASSRRNRPMPAPLSIPMTFLFVAMGWVWFRANSLPLAISYFGRMFGITQPPQGTVDIIGMINGQVLLALPAAVIFSFSPIIFEKIGKQDNKIFIPQGQALTAARFFFCMLLTLASLASLVSSGFNPFIYFQF
jgi:alginate O-acetyltransferase complex protein AlgI